MKKLNYSPSALAILLVASAAIGTYSMIGHASEGWMWIASSTAEADYQKKCKQEEALKSGKVDAQIKALVEIKEDIDNLKKEADALKKDLRDYNDRRQERWDRITALESEIGRLVAVFSKLWAEIQRLSSDPVRNAFLIKRYRQLMAENERQQKINLDELKLKYKFLDLNSEGMAPTKQKLDGMNYILEGVLKPSYKAVYDSLDVVQEHLNTKLGCTTSYLPKKGSAFDLSFEAKEVMGDVNGKIDSASQAKNYSGYVCKASEVGVLNRFELYKEILGPVGTKIKNTINISKLAGDLQRIIQQDWDNNLEVRANFAIAAKDTASARSLTKNIMTFTKYTRATLRAAMAAGTVAAPPSAGFSLTEVAAIAFLDNIIDNATQGVIEKAESYDNMLDELDAATMRMKARETASANLTCKIEQDLCDCVKVASASPSPSPTPTPTPTPTPAPTSTPIATADPGPTSTPTPTGGPSPTISPISTLSIDALNNNYFNTYTLFGACDGSDPVEISYRNIDYPEWPRSPAVFVNCAGGSWIDSNAFYMAMYGPAEYTAKQLGHSVFYVLDENHPSRSPSPTVEPTSTPEATLYPEPTGTPEPSVEPSATPYPLSINLTADYYFLKIFSGECDQGPLDLRKISPENTLVQFVPVDCQPDHTWSHYSYFSSNDGSWTLSDTLDRSAAYIFPAPMLPPCTCDRPTDPSFCIQSDGLTTNSFSNFANNDSSCRVQATPEPTPDATILPTPNPSPPLTIDSVTPSGPYPGTNTYTISGQCGNSMNTVYLSSEDSGIGNAAMNCGNAQWSWTANTSTTGSIRLSVSQGAQSWSGSFNFGQ